MISTHTSILYSGMYTSSYTLYASRGSKCAPSCFDLPGLLNIESYGQTPHYNKYLNQISPRCLTHYTIGNRGKLNTHYHQTTYPSSPQLTYDRNTYYNKPDGHSSTTRMLTGHNSRKTQSPLTLRPPYPTIYTLPT